MGPKSLRVVFICHVCKTTVTMKPIKGPADLTLVKKCNILLDNVGSDMDSRSLDNSLSARVHRKYKECIIGYFRL
jgi:hypothetical protein